MRLEFSARRKRGDFLLDASFDVTADRIGLFGPSGSGKSTVVGLLSGLASPDAGRIALDGETLFDSARAVDLPPERRRIGVVFQRGHLFPHLSVEGNLRYGWHRCPASERRVEPGPVVEALELEPLLRRPVDNLSGGERQRIALGRAILASPRLILLDEPLSALDDALKYRIIPYLRKAFDAFGIPCLFITHSVVEMRLMAERVVVLEGGRVSEETDAERLAIRRMASGGAAYLNLLRLSGPRDRNGLAIFPWGGLELAVATSLAPGVRVFELSARDIILFRKHPEAISARNLLPCEVAGLNDFDGRVGVELACGTARLVAEVMRETAGELDLKPGTTLFAAIKASAFREIF